MKSKIITDAEKSLLIQKHQVDSASSNIDKIDSAVNLIRSRSDKNQSSLNSLENDIDALLNKFNVSEVDLENINNCKMDKSLILTDLEKENIKAKSIGELDSFGIDKLDTIENIYNWNTYIENVRAYSEKHNIDLNVNPYQQLFTKDEYDGFIGEYEDKFGKIKWQGSDYAIVGFSVLIAVLVDYFIVRVPLKNNGTLVQKFRGNEYQGSPVTKFFLDTKNKIINPTDADPQIFSSLNKLQKKLENYAKVPFDVATNKHTHIGGAEVSNLGPRTHRLQSLGHDPIFGAIFGIRDIMAGRMTVIDGKGNILDLSNVASSRENNIFTAILKWACHILSDVPTSQGLPVPGLAFLQAIKADSPFVLGKSGEKVSFAHLSRFMYTNGYTLEHFITMSLVPMIIEIIISVYHYASNFDTLYKMDGYKKKDDVKLQSMLAMAHTFTMGGNIAKMAIMQWNPTAFNLPECVRMVQTWMNLYKASNKRDEKINKYLYQGWSSLEESFK